MPVEPPCPSPILTNHLLCFRGLALEVGRLGVFNPAIHIAFPFFILLRLLIYKDKIFGKTSIFAT